MKNWGALPLAVEIDAAVELLRRSGMNRAATRLELKVHKTTPTPRTVQAFVGGKRTRGNQFPLKTEKLEDTETKE